MRFEWNTLETRPGVCLSVDGQNRLHTSPPWASLLFIYRNQEDTPHGIVSYCLPPLSGSQQKANGGGESRSSRNGRAESYRHERSEDGQKWMLALVSFG